VTSETPLPAAPVSSSVDSSDDVSVVVHDLGGAGRPVLLSHATGFHGRCWGPVADELADEFHCLALDYRGHGSTSAPHDWQVDWERYGDDAVAVARSIFEAYGSPIIGVGHSMGGACLLIAARREPELFAGLVVFEPIVFPGDFASTGDPAEHPLAVGARRRRAGFASVEDAVSNYAAKPPMAAFTPSALRAYVQYGTRPADDGDGIVLCCSPEHEARTFETGGAHRTWDALGEISTPTLVLAGRPDPASPATLAPQIAARLPRGAFRVIDHVDHFAPMTHPDLIARAVSAFVEELTRSPHSAEPGD
jgi:pimeloyl-ACP methyl ester carboxylesterase